jgi:hypothetical protein
MENPYFKLHGEFIEAGAEVLLSSGQACVVFGIAAFSKDGDWIIRDNKGSCTAVLKVLGQHHAVYRLGAPLAPDWLALGMTSHFEFMTAAGFRMRADFCSHPPRVPDVEQMWKRAVRTRGMDVVDVESLVQLKQTRRLRDYSIIGALAEVAGLEGNTPAFALGYLQDYELLSRAVRNWPRDAAVCRREAVRLLLGKAPRASVVAAIAVEQDIKIQADQARIDAMQARLRGYARAFAKLRFGWRRSKTPLAAQHRQLLVRAQSLLKEKP